MAAEARSFHGFEVEKLERELFDAYQRRDVERLDRILDRDYLFIAANGQLRTKEAVRNFSWPHYQRLALDEVQVRVYGETAVLTSLVTIQGEYASDGISGAYRNTRVYVRQRGRWRAVSGQSTRIA
ncbi:MAG: nuclear transport factor 2 family protein [Terriglobales bacterium]